MGVHLHLQVCRFLPLTQHFVQRTRLVSATHTILGSCCDDRGAFLTIAIESYSLILVTGFSCVQRDLSRSRSDGMQRADSDRSGYRQLSPNLCSPRHTIWTKPTPTTQNCTYQSRTRQGCYFLPHCKSSAATQQQRWQRRVVDTGDLETCSRLSSPTAALQHTRPLLWRQEFPEPSETMGEFVWFLGLSAAESSTLQTAELYNCNKAWAQSRLRRISLCDAPFACNHSRSVIRKMKWSRNMYRAVHVRLHKQTSLASAI